MKSINKYRTFLLLSSIIVIATSCKKFVEIGPPQTALVTESVFANNATATTAVTAIYIQMYNNLESYLISQVNGLLSDEQQNYSTVTTQVQFYTNAMLATSGTTGEWTNAYNYIYQANAVMEGLKGNSNIYPSVSRQLTGEALFIRAYWLFYLTNCYGAIPLTTTTDYKVNESLSRTPRAQVYQQVITDLLQAQSLLSPNYVDISDTVTSTDRVRPNKWAATALLARAYLYASDWKDAQAQATAVLNNPSLYSLDTLNGVFLAANSNHKEAIWQLATPLPSTINTNDGQYYILQSAPSNTLGATALSQQLMASFEDGDNRRAKWVDSIAFGTTVYYFPYKYQVYDNTHNPNSRTEYTMVLRLAEQYLIRAEAEAEQNNLSGATTDLNAIRTRAGLPNIPGTIASSQTAMLKAILHERQVELFTEWGHRWFDLNRTHSADSVLGAPGNVCQYKGGTWNATDSLYPIPQSERNSDPNLSQNVGY